MTKNDPNFTIDFLLTDAKVRLAFERLRHGKSTAISTEEPITFLPLAAAGSTPHKEVQYYSQDHNFQVTYQRDNAVYCDLQAQGYAAIELVAHKSVQVCFDGRYFFLANFNDQGFSRLTLPLSSPDQRPWWTLPFTIKV